MSSAPAYISPRLLIQLPAGTNNGLYSKSKETFSRLQRGAPFAAEETPSQSKMSATVATKLPWSTAPAQSFRSCACGAQLPVFLCWCDQVHSEGKWLCPFVSLTLFISFTHFPFGPLCSGARRQWLLQASQTSEDLTRLWDETEQLHALLNGG